MPLLIPGGWLAAAALLSAAASYAGSGGPLRASAPVRITTSGDHEKPCLARRPGGGAYLAWAERAPGGTSILFAVSPDGLRYGPPVRVSTDGMDLDLGAENGPSVAVGPEGRIYVAWVAGSWKVKSAHGHGARSAGGTKKGPPPRPGNLSIFLATSTDDGKSFSHPIRVNDDPNGPEHRFPTVATDEKGTLYVAWLDKRKETPEKPGFSRVFLTRSTDGGKSFAPSVDATAGQDDGICHCCRLALAIHPREGLRLAFRNDVKDMRDIFMVASTDGTSFTRPEPIEGYRWTIPSCPFNGPSLAYDAAGNLHAAWMTGGNSAGKPLVGEVTGATYKVMYRRQDAVSRRWSEPLCLAEGTHPRILVTSGGIPYVVWDGEGIQVARLSPHGQPAALRLTPASRAYAFPAIAETAGGGLLVGWQKTDDTGKTELFASRVSAERNRVTEPGYRGQPRHR